MPCSFAEFFMRVTGHPPYSYQERLATGDEFPELLDIPTGLGKTLAVVVAWLWRRRFAAVTVRSKTPRRLVYRLPMRVLVEQTYDVLCRCLEAARSFAAEQGIVFEPLAVHVLMGGEELTDWAMWPEQDAILLGTQDMLLSRALNRGYAASRARWPTEFGLLTNDCVWVLDEVQLMGSGLTTTAQLDTFFNGGKQSKGLGSFGRCLFLWMSATIRPDWLETVDHRRPARPATGLSLEERQGTDSPLGQRIHATKSLRPAENRTEDRPAALAREILAAHQAANQEEDLPVLTLVVVNTVKRAVALHSELTKLLAKEKRDANLLLIHSRFRPPDRKALIDRLL